MTSWTTDQLDRIGDADELQISAPRSDGRPRRPVPIWVVRHGDGLYVRSYRGASGGWYRGAQLHHEGRISVGGVDAEVAFTEVLEDDAVQDHLDAVYRSKYGRYGPGYVDAMVAPQARATTLRLDPR
ncbi:DUF2255 family protein [Cryptosporangium aurantiacum]|uniref:DUF2255 family protein n=1 Tax=Cryptosporangium aurantiacum TaxID=134849 RepID=A0A1M7R3E2_9ACTN|nr:DUF2255 family protein [Cryptosporangium aurantiacum]SHN39470.1 hypothetical protein SAMN05443668_106291 [Cryptosporangium aurantiacum]